MKHYLIAILKGIAIGVANIIPGVSGGTLMVTMNIYDLFIESVTHLFRQFKKSITTLLPYVIGIAAALLLLSSLLKTCMQRFPYPTAFAFIGLICGGLPVIWKACKNDIRKPLGILLCLCFLALTILLEVLRPEEVNSEIRLSFMEVIKLVLLGALASATMVIPGVSGSMILMLTGYYWPVIGAVSDLKNVLHGDMSAFSAAIGVLLPFGVGIVVGIFVIAKLIEILLKNHKGMTYCGIMGLVISSPVVILMSTAGDIRARIAEAATPEAAAVYEGMLSPGAGVIAACVVTFLIGLAVALLMQRLDRKNEEKNT